MSHHSAEEAANDAMSSPAASSRSAVSIGRRARRRDRHRCRAALRCAATSGACGSRRVGSANGPSQGLSCGGFQRRWKTTPDRCSAISAARALRAIHQTAPAGSISKRICFCALLATPRRDFSSRKIDFPRYKTNTSGTPLLTPRFFWNIAAYT